MSSSVHGLVSERRKSIYKNLGTTDGKNSAVSLSFHLLEDVFLPLTGIWPNIFLRFLQPHLFGDASSQALPLTTVGPVQDMMWAQMYVDQMSMDA